MEKLLSNKKGLSTVVTTLIIVLLVLVAVGIIWYVISEVLDTGAGNIEYNAKCLEVDMNFVTVEQDGNTFNIAVQRSAGGDDIDGAKLIWYYTDQTNEILPPHEGNVGPLDQFAVLGVAIPSGKTVTKMEVLAYFIKENGEEHLCTVTDTYFVGGSRDSPTDVTLNNPSDGTTFNTGDSFPYTVPFTATVTDDDGVAEVWLIGDGTDLNTELASGAGNTYTGSYDFNSNGPPPHTWTVRVVDSDGNEITHTPTASFTLVT